MQIRSFVRSPEPSRAAAPLTQARRAARGGDDLAHCRALLANGSRTFLAASFLLPRSVRDPACALYAFCRVADDAIDTAAQGDIEAALARVRGALDRTYDGAPAGAVERAFSWVVHRHAIPRALPEALLEGFAWDVTARRYETMADLHDYAARVAGSVGAMMALVMGARSPAALARACDLGVAMQLSNIARDVGEDARLGRVYLPMAWMRQAGIDVDAFVAAPRHDARVAGVVTRVLAHADALYARVGAGVAELPAGCRVGINAARFLYAEIGREVGRRGGNSIDSRAVVPGWRKAALLVRAVACLMPRRGAPEPPLPGTHHLVEAAATCAPPARAPTPPLGQGRVVWLLELFERLERQDRLRHAGSLR